MADTRTHKKVEKLFIDVKTGKTKDTLSIDNSLAAHVRWRKQYKQSCEGRLAMITSCPTIEAVEYLRIVWRKYEMKCRDIKIGTTILLEKDPTVKDRIMTGIEEQSTEYAKLSSHMGQILAELTRFKQENPAPAAGTKKEKEPKIMKELCPDILTKDMNLSYPILTHMLTPPLKHSSQTLTGQGRADSRPLYITMCTYVCARLTPTQRKLYNKELVPKYLRTS